MGFLFEWDEAKATANRRKHGVEFEEALNVFNDPLACSIPDPAHSRGEERRVALGLSCRCRLVLVVFTERGPCMRLISVRPATSAERKRYAEGQG